MGQIDCFTRMAAGQKQKTKKTSAHRRLLVMKKCNDHLSSNRSDFEQVPVVVNRIQLSPNDRNSKMTAFHQRYRLLYLSLRAKYIASNLNFIQVIADIPESFTGRICYFMIA